MGEVRALPGKPGGDNNLDQVITIVGALGIGSLITVLVQSWLSGKSEGAKQLFGERKEAYSGLLKAWHSQMSSGSTNKTQSEIGYWWFRTELVASKQLIVALEEMLETDPGTDRRDATLSIVKSEMRTDLMQGRK